MNISEQPARIFAIIIFGPYLIYKGSHIKDNILIFFGFILILYELFWIINYNPKTITIN